MNEFVRKKIEDDGPKPSSHTLLKAFGGPGEESPMRKLLGENGPLAQALPGYRERDSQIALADAVYQGLVNEKHVIAEAGTGTGKSLAALVPAIKAVVDRGGAKNNHRILVSTAMIVLQDQYTGKDLPFLQENLDINFKWVVRKGRGNYVCDNRVERAYNGELQIRTEHGAEFNTLCEWSTDTETGDTAELPFELNKASYTPLKVNVTATSDNCRGKNCDFLEQCWYFYSKRKAEQCEIIVVNHALLVLNHCFFNAILPEYDAVIIDEAHKLEDVVRSSLQATLTPRSFVRILKGVRILGLIEEKKLDKFEDTVEECINEIEVELGRYQPEVGSVRFDIDAMSEKFVENMETLINICRTLYITVQGEAEKEMESGGDPDESQAVRLLKKIEDLGTALKEFSTADAKNSTFWIERDRKDDGTDKITLNSAPVSVAGFMRATLLQKPCMFLSATLATGYGSEAFTHFKDSMGIDQAIELQVPSPFDYLRNTRYLLARYPNGLEKPPGDTMEWCDYLDPRVNAVLRVSDAGALLLFTSRRVCDEMYYRIQAQKESHWDIYCQGEMSKQDTIAAFKESNHSILCATSSFFEGVDIPGACLRFVFLDKIPFPIAGDPIVKALIEYHGRSWFNDFFLVYAILTMKQAFGRLNRKETDRGLLMCADPRLRSKSYGNKILDVMPGYTHCSRLPEIKEFMEGILRDAKRA